MNREITWTAFGKLHSASPELARLALYDPFAKGVIGVLSPRGERAHNQCQWQQTWTLARRPLMRSPHILLLNKNVVELKRELARILSKKSSRVFDAEVEQNVVQLFDLGRHHFEFAQVIPAVHWRQVVSRCYYGAYSVSKAVRLAVRGHYSQEVKDHEKVGDLPDDFPDKNTYANRLRLLRDDRNLCDYDHTAVAADLGLSSADTLTLVGNFVQHARVYLRSRHFHV